MDKEKIKTAIKYVSWIVITAVIGFVLFVVIGVECNYKPAIQVQDYLSERWGITTLTGVLSALFIFWKMLTAMTSHNDKTSEVVDELKAQIETTLSSTNTSNEAITSASDAIETNLATELEKMQELLTSLSSLSDREKILEDILVYFVLGNSESKNVEELKTLLGQSKLMEQARKLREAFDLDQDGNVTLEEAKKVVAENPEKLEPIYKSVINSIRKKLE